MGTGNEVVVLGEALIDLVVALDGSVAARPGGAPLNTARTVARLGTPAAFGGAVSTDRFGTTIRDAIGGDGVATHLVQTVDAPTTLAVAELDAGGAATYRFYLDGTSAPSFDCPPVPASSRVIVTGGLALALEPMAGSIDRAIGAASAETLVLVDINCRPAVVTDRARYLGRVHSVLGRADVVKVSDDDLAYLMPGSEPLDAARSLFEHGVALVLVTMGAAGTAVLAEHWDRHVAAQAVDVVDTIGAGDAFGGALAAWWWSAGLDRRALVDGDVVERAVSAANQVAAITCTRRGADPPRREELPAGWAP